MDRDVALRFARSDRQVRALGERVVKAQAGAGAALAAVAALSAAFQQASTTTGALSIGATDVVVSWPLAWPDTTYGVYVELATGAGVLGNVHATVKSKSTVDVTVTVAVAVAVGAVVVAVLGVRK